MRFFTFAAEYFYFSFIYFGKVYFGVAANRELIV